MNIFAFQEAVPRGLWVAIDADTKLVLSHIVGSRTPPTAYDFMLDVASRIKFDDATKPHAERRRVQLTTDGPYWYATCRSATSVRIVHAVPTGQG